MVSNANDLQVVEPALPTPNREVDDLDKEPTLNHPFSQTEKSSKCKKRLRNNHRLLVCRISNKRGFAMSI